MNQRARRLPALWVAASALLLFPTADLAQRATPRGRNPRPAPVARECGLSGITTVNLVGADRAGRLFDTSHPTQNAYTNPNTTGVTFRTSWAAVEPEEGRFDFNKIDTVFANAEKNGKWVDLILIPGFATPDWAMQGAQSGMFAVQYGPGAGTGTLLPLPVPWDRTYLSRWFTFLKAIGSRYAAKTSFRMIAAAGPTSVSSEISLPDSQNDIDQWKNLGYTTQKYVQAWRETLGVYVSTFPHQYFSLSLHPALPIPDKSQGPQGREQIVSLGLQYPSQFALESDGLNSSRSDVTLGLVRDHSGQVCTGFMMSTAATDRSQRMGAEGDPPLALRKSIDVGMEPGKSGQHVNYLGIYEPDVVADAMQPELRHAASLFTRKPPSQ
jgi:hypothetical protein